MSLSAGVPRPYNDTTHSAAVAATAPFRGVEILQLRVTPLPVAVSTRATPST